MSFISALGRKQLVFFIFSIFVSLTSCSGNWNKSEEAHKSSDSIPSSPGHIRIGIVSWGGYAGGVSFNQGLEDNINSRFQKEYGIHVTFHLYKSIKDYEAAFKNNEIDLIWATMDVLPTYFETFAKQKLQVLFQVDWSNGGDVLIARNGINAIADLKEKKVAFVPLTLSHTLLISALKNTELRYRDIAISEMNSEEEVLKSFKNGKVDAVAIWSPYDIKCLELSGSKVLLSSKETPNLIADIFVGRTSFASSHHKELVALIKGWMKANDEINTSLEKREAAAKILAKAFHISSVDALTSISKATLCSMKDNIKFFGNDSSKINSVGKSIFLQWSGTYNKLNYTPAQLPPWDSIAGFSIFNEISSKEENTATENKKSDSK